MSAKVLARGDRGLRMRGNLETIRPLARSNELLSSFTLTPFAVKRSKEENEGRVENEEAPITYRSESTLRSAAARLARTRSLLQERRARRRKRRMMMMMMMTRTEAAGSDA